MRVRSETRISPAPACPMIRAASWTATPAHAATDDLDLADVHAGPHLQPLALGGTHDRRRAMQRRRRRGEGGEQPVASRVHLAPAEALELHARGLEVLREQVPPARVAQPRGDRGGVDEVREEKRDEHAAVDPGREARERADPGPLDLDARLVADRPAVVARRNVEDVVGAELEPRAVLELDPESSREDHPQVARLAPLAADGRAHAVAPAPARAR